MGVSGQELGVGKGKEEAWVWLLLVPQSHGWLIWGAGKGPSCIHRVIHCRAHPWWVVCMHTCVHESALTHPAQGPQSLLRDHLTLGNPHHGCFLELFLNKLFL